MKENIEEKLKGYNRTEFLKDLISILLFIITTYVERNNLH